MSRSGEFTKRTLAGIAAAAALTGVGATAAQAQYYQQPSLPSAFGSTNTRVFGNTNAPVFGSTNTRVFGSTNTPVFGNTNVRTFGSTRIPPAPYSSGYTIAPVGYQYIITQQGIIATPVYGAYPNYGYGYYGYGTSLIR